MAKRSSGYPPYPKGERAERKVARVMHEWKAGDLHSGGSGKVVKDQKQAIAIALSEARRASKKGYKARG